MKLKFGKEDSATVSQSEDGQRVILEVTQRKSITARLVLTGRQAHKLSEALFKAGCATPILVCPNCGHKMDSHNILQLCPKCKWDFDAGCLQGDY